MSCEGCYTGFGPGARQCVLRCGHSFCAPCLAKQPRSDPAVIKCSLCKMEVKETAEMKGIQHFTKRGAKHHVIATAGFALPRRLVEFKYPETLKLTDEVGLPMNIHVGLRVQSSDVKFLMLITLEGRQILSIELKFKNNHLLMEIKNTGQLQCVELKSAFQFGRCHEIMCVETIYKYIVLWNGRKIMEVEKRSYFGITSTCKEVDLYGAGYLGVDLNHFYISNRCFCKAEPVLSRLQCGVHSLLKKMSIGKNQEN